MSKFAMIAALIAAVQTAIFVGCHVALINQEQADYSDVLLETCLVLQHIAEGASGGATIGTVTGSCSIYIHR